MLTQPCHTLTGVGVALAKKLEKCGIQTIMDLLLHAPFRYQDRTRITPICDLRAEDWCVVTGNVCKVDIKQGKRKILDCYIQDNTGILKLRFFHFHPQQVTKLHQSPTLRVFGEIRSFQNQFEMVHPDYQILEPDKECPVEETLTPIYSSTQGLTQNRLRQIIQLALHEYQTSLHALEWMDASTLSRLHLPTFANALQILHAPDPETPLSLLENAQHPALRRLILEELLADQLSMQFARQKRRSYQAIPIPAEKTQQHAFLSKLPFPLTNAQTRVLSTIEADLTQPTPMLRLIQGDVGSGKTVVAALAALQAASAGYQVAIMAPTDLLSEQHLQTITPWFEPFAIPILRLSGQMKARERKTALQTLQTQTNCIVIGTHALFQADVTFARLGLVIIDEQHRFGVSQRLQLQQKGQYDNTLPHQLFMTATPIPRTLAMAQMAHLDISTLDELPPGRTPVTTAIIPAPRRESLMVRLQDEIKAGRQIYWVCPLIEESEVLQCMAATVSAEDLKATLPEASIGLVHGRLKSHEKEAVMQAFKDGSIDILVATTVIEVGVNVPNASLMIIENAERMGLAQLHQLRGRVGRGHQQSHCILLYQGPLSAQASERLQVMRASQDGFFIAEKDLTLRGAGELLGTRQTGERRYKMTQLARDHTLLPLATRMAELLVTKYPETAQQVVTRWFGSAANFLQG